MKPAWVLTEVDGPVGLEQHVRPVDDTREHVESLTCWCLPVRHAGDGNSTFKWAHNAEDGRA